MPQNLNKRKRSVLSKTDFVFLWRLISLLVIISGFSAISEKCNHEIKVLWYSSRIKTIELCQNTKVHFNFKRFLIKVLFVCFELKRPSTKILNLVKQLATQYICSLCVVLEQTELLIAVHWIDDLFHFMIHYHAYSLLRMHKHNFQISYPNTMLQRRIGHDGVVEVDVLQLHIIRTPPLGTIFLQSTYIIFRRNYLYACQVCNN